MGSNGASKTGSISIERGQKWLIVQKFLATVKYGSVFPPPCFCGTSKVIYHIILLFQEYKMPSVPHPRSLITLYCCFRSTRCLLGHIQGHWLHYIAGSGYNVPSVPHPRSLITLYCCSKSTKCILCHIQGHWSHCDILHEYICIWRLVRLISIISMPSVPHPRSLITLFCCFRRTRCLLCNIQGHDSVLP